MASEHPQAWLHQSIRVKLGNWNRKWRGRETDGLSAGEMPKPAASSVKNMMVTFSRHLRTLTENKALSLLYPKLSPTTSLFLLFLLSPLSYSLGEHHSLGLPACSLLHLFFFFFLSHSLACVCSSPLSCLPSSAPGRRLALCLECGVGLIDEKAE